MSSIRFTDKEVKARSEFNPEDAIDCLVGQVKCRGSLNSNEKHIIHSWKAYEILIDDGRLTDAENFLVSVFKCLVTSGRSRAMKEENLVKIYYDLFMRVAKFNN